MNPERWDRIKVLFGEALDLDPSARDSFLQRQADSQPELVSEVKALLVRHESPLAFLDLQMARLPFETPAPASRILTAGEIVNGRFRILRFLGQGGMGSVFEAEDLELQIRVALKTVRPDVAAEGEMRERFRQEVLLARTVTHPNVCRLYDVGTWAAADAPPTLFMTMELLEGETLASRLRREGKFRPGAALPLMRQMAAALDAAHAAGVLHRDFKSANVMLVRTQEGGERAVIMDFGLARGLDAGRMSKGGTCLTQTGAVVGTPAYMAPEQIEGKRAGTPADIYAFGVVLYEMLAGQRPYEGLSPLAMAAKKVRDAPSNPGDFAPGLNARWQAAILRCLAIDPAHRYTHAREVLDALESRHPVWPAFVRTARWQNSRVPASAALLIMALLGTAWWLAQSRAGGSLSGEASRRYSQGVAAIHAGAFGAPVNCCNE